MDELLMLSGVELECPDCAGPRVFVPALLDGPDGEWCCTACDAAVVVLDVRVSTVDAARRQHRAA